MDERLRIDPRSLTLFRVLAASVLILDGLRVWPHLAAFYTHGGIIADGFGWPLAAVRALVVFGLVSSAAWLAGWRAAWTHGASALYFIVFMNLNGVLRHGGDWMLANLLVFSWPLSAAARPAAGRPSPVSGRLVAAALLLHGPAIYLLSAWAKRGPSWLDGTAVHYALSIRQYAGPAGWLVADAPPAVVAALTWSTLALEWLAPLALIAAARRDAVRRVALGALVFLHAALAVCLPVLWDIQAVMLAGLAVWLAPADWDALERLLPRAAARLSRLRSRLQTLPGAAEGSPPSAALRAGEALAALTALAFCVNAYNRDVARRLGAPELPGRWLAPVYDRLQLGRSWGFFGPEPPRHDGWWVADAQLASGERLDLFTGRPPSGERPDGWRHRFDRYWRFALSRAFVPKRASLPPKLGAWLLRRAERDGLAVRRLELCYMADPTPEPGKARGAATRHVLWSTGLLSAELARVPGLE